MLPAYSRVTIKDIAARTGVTHPTVSRALRNDPRVKESTRLRIQKMARTLGYRPDPAMSILVTHRNRNSLPGKHSTICVLDPWTGSGLNFSYYFSLQLKGIRHRGEELGYRIETFPVPPESSRHRQISRILISRGIKALVAPSPPSGFPAFELKWEHFSVVGIGRNVRPSSLHYVAHDNIACIDTAYQRLQQAGYRRIGFFDQIHSEARNQHLYLSSYLKNLAIGNIAFDKSPPYLFHDAKSIDPLPWIQKHRFDAVIAGYHDILIGKLESHGVRIPRDLAVVSISLRPEDHDVAGNQDNFLEHGRMAVELLHKMLLTGERGLPRQEYSILIKGNWCHGGTMLSGRLANP